MNRSRRTVIAAAAGFALFPTAAVPAPSRIVVFREFASTMEDQRRHWLAMFAEHGMAQGTNVDLVIVNVRELKEDRIEPKAREVVSARPSLIMTDGNWAMMFKRLTRETPIIFWDSNDPVREGLVDSFRRPGGNVTGVSNRGIEIAGKTLELLKELAPGARRVAVVISIDEFTEQSRRDIGPAVTGLGLQMVEVLVREDAPANSVAAAIRRARPDAVMLAIGRGFVTIDPAFIRQVNELAVPVSYGHPTSVHRGGLFSLGRIVPELQKRAVGIAVQVIRGANPATIPVDQAARFHLAVNLATARAIGIRVPASILVRADEVVE